jgi:hypothetical protein
MKISGQGNTCPLMCYYLPHKKGAAWHTAPSSYIMEVKHEKVFIYKDSRIICIFCEHRKRDL